MSVAVAMAVNPVDESQTLVLMNDGRIVLPVGSTAIDPHVDFGFNPAIGKDLVVTDWATPSGYALDGFGVVHAFGAAVAVSPTGLWVTSGTDQYRAMSMNPAADGTGYVLRNDGAIIGIGLADLSGTIFAGGDYWRDLVVKWDSSGSIPLKAWYSLDCFNAVHAGGGALNVDYPDPWYKAGQNVAKVLMVVDWATPIVYSLDIYGNVYPHDLAASKPGADTPRWSGFGPAQDMQLISYTPFVYDVLDWNGVVWNCVVSSPPVTTITAPAGGATIATTTRPSVSWAVSDAQNDRIAKVTARLFSAAQYGAGGFDPKTSTPTFEAVVTDRSVTSTQTTDRVPNGVYRWYVWATEAVTLYDSTVVNVQFTMSVAAPPTPTIVAAAAPNDPSVGITITASSPPAGSVFDVQASDDGGTTWATVPGLGAVPAASAVMVTDWTIPTHTTRTYRARIEVPSLLVDGAWSATQTARCDLDGWWLSNPLEAAAALSVRMNEIDPVKRRTAGEFDPIGQAPAIVIADVPKAEKGTFKVAAYTAADRIAIEAILDSVGPLLLRDYWGRHTFLAITGDITRDLMQIAPEPGSSIPLADAQVLTVPYAEVAAPT